MGPAVVVTKSSPEQRALDYEYSSTDDDHDGVPDNLQHGRKPATYAAPAYKAAAPAYEAAPAYDSYDAPPAYGPVKKVVAPAPVIVQQQVPIVPVVDVVVPVVQDVVRVVPQQRFVDVQPARQPVGIVNPTQQQLEDLANQSLDANNDGIPDELVGAFGPAEPVVQVAAIDPFVRVQQPLVVAEAPVFVQQQQRFLPPAGTFFRV